MLSKLAVISCEVMHSKWLLLSGSCMNRKRNLCYQLKLRENFLLISTNALVVIILHVDMRTKALAEMAGKSCFLFVK